MSSHPTPQQQVANLEAEAHRFAKLAQFEFSPRDALHLRGTAASLMEKAAEIRQADLMDAARQQVLRRGVRYRPAKPIEPVRPVTNCATCNDGCDCEGGVEGIGCEHYGCWGRASTNECPSAPPLIEHLHARTQYGKDLHAYEQQAHSYRTARR